MDSREDTPDDSSRHAKLGLEAYREGKISLGKLAEFLGTSVEDVRNLVWDLQVEQLPANSEGSAPAGGTGPAAHWP
jgi:hypothetical protein